MDDIGQKANIIYKKGQRIGQYEIVNTLEPTPFGLVYQAEHMYLRTAVTIEVFQLPLSNELRDDFLDQTKALQKIEHPHILRLLDAGVQKHHPFLVTDYGPYRTFRQMYPQGSRNTLDMFLPFLKQITSALQYIHDLRIIHGDIRPENILLDNNNAVLLRGFSIEALALNRERLRYQRTGVEVEAVNYSAPERIQRKGSPASDQYSLAVVVYELLGGSLPFTGTSIEIAHQQMHSSPPALRSKTPAVSPEVDRAVMRALSKEPEQRFPSIQAFINALGQPEQQQPRTADVPRKPAQPTGAIDLAALPQAGQPAPFVDPTAVTNLQMVQPVFTPPAANVPPTFTPPAPPAANVPPTFTPPAPPPFAPAGPPPGIMHTQAASVPPPYTPPGPPPRPVNNPISNVPPPYAPQAQTVAALPQPFQTVTPNVPPPVSEPPAPRREDSKVTRRAFAVGLVGLAALGGAGGWYLLSQRVSTPGTSPALTPNSTAPATQTVINNTRVLIFSGHLASVNAIAWSPDGKFIASASDDTFVQVFDARAGTRQLIYSGHSEEVAAIGWSPDGKLIASGGQDKTVQIWNASSKAKVLTYTGHTDRVNGLSWAKNSLLVASGSDDKSVQVWNVNTGESAFNFLGHTAGVLCVGWQPDNTSVASGSWDGTLRDWATVQHGQHFNAGDQIFNYGGHGKNEVTALAWSPDSNFIASAGADQTVQISNGDNGTPRPPFFTGHQNKQHVNRVLAVSWSPDGTSIASGDTDGNVYVWHTTGRQTFFRYQGHKGAVNAVAWSPDGKTIASASSDATVHVWQPGQN